jgi:mannose-6-phosphate isomerase-like protein (cupin superfamily)
MLSIILQLCKMIGGPRGKEKDTMSSAEGQLQSEAKVNGAQQEATSRIFALDPGEGEAWWWMGGLATIKATQEQTGGHYTLVEILVPELSMEESMLHVHHFEDEGFYILEGEMTFYVGERTIKARPGSYLFGPKDVPHAFSVDSGPARLLFILSPAGMEGGIREMGEPARSLSIPRWGGSWPSPPNTGERCWDLRRVGRSASQRGEGPSLPRGARSFFLPLFTLVRGEAV